VSSLDRNSEPGGPALVSLTDTSGSPKTSPGSTTNYPSATRHAGSRALPMRCFTLADFSGTSFCRGIMCEPSLSVAPHRAANGCNHLAQSALAQHYYSTNVLNGQGVDPTQAPNKEGSFLPRMNDGGILSRFGDKIE